MLVFGDELGGGYIYLGSYTPVFPSSPPKSGSSKVGCIPPPPPPVGPNPPPRKGSCGPRPGGYRSRSPMLSGLLSPPNPLRPGGLLISYSSSKPGGGKSPVGNGLRGGPASGSFVGRDGVNRGRRSSRSGSRSSERWCGSSPGLGCCGCGDDVVWVSS